MFKLASHIAYDNSWSIERKCNWAGSEVADLAAKRALGARDKDACHCAIYAGWARFARAAASVVAKSQSYCLQHLAGAAHDVLARRGIVGAAAGSSRICPATSGHTRAA